MDRYGAPIDLRGISIALLYRAANLGEYVVGIRSDESNRAYDDDQNHSQHHRVLRNVLAMLIIPQLL